MSNLVELTSRNLDATPFTTGNIIAEYANIELASVNRTIRKVHSRLEHFGKVRIKIQAMPSGQKAKTYLLNQAQATLLITFLKNTPKVANFKEELVRQFMGMQQELFERRARFELGKEFSKSLQGAISASPSLGENGHLYININRLVYKQALGVTTAQLRKARHIPKTDAITHYLSANEADAIRKVKDQIITLLDLKMNYQQIKTALQRQGVINQIRLTLPMKSIAAKR